MPPAPALNPRRRHARVGPQELPACGRVDARGRRRPAPSWPLDEPASPAELRVWKELWAAPQAVAWESLGWVRVVARYARTVLEAERLSKDAMSEARQLEDRLGLTPKAMRVLLWTVGGSELEQSAEVVTPDRWRDAAAS